MMMTRLFALFVVFLLAPGKVFAKDDLPRVLILTDQVLSSAARTVVSEFKGRAHVVVSPPIGDTQSVLKQLDVLLGEGQWDLIHFNLGLANLRHIDSRAKSLRIMSRHFGGVKNTNPEQYDANLREIVARLQQTKANLIWASTTPIVGTKHDHVFEPGSEKVYNEIAATIMREEKIPVNDLHAWVLENVKKFNDTLGFRRVPIHEPIVASIEQVLRIPPKPAQSSKAKKK